jgi:fructokinase
MTETPERAGTALVVGEALIDIVQRHGRALGEHVGGSPLNVAFGLARLSRDVEFLTWIADDPRGHRIADHLRGAGVRLAAGSVAASRTATAVASLDASGSASYDFDIEWRLSPIALSGTSGSAPLVLHTGSIAAFLEPGCKDVAALIETHSSVATITFDPNVRPPLIDDPDEGRARIDAFIARADVVKASDEDMRWLEPSAAPEELAARWLAMGPALVAVTLGASGAFAVSASGATRRPARTTNVVDTVGAGDAFMTGLIDSLWDLGLLGAHRRESLHDIGSDVVGQVLDAAILSSALTVARMGADLPDRATRDAAAKVAGIAATRPNLAT